MKFNFVLLPAAAILTGCAATMSAQQASDYNGDGVVSDAEFKQFNKQSAVQERNVYTESVKREGAVGTVRDVNEAIWTARSILSGLRSF
jgi:outer membrane biogenesis lipoprotein LolB